MLIKRYDNANDFLIETQKFLEKSESTNNIILGTSLRLRNKKTDSINNPYFVSIKENENIILVAMITPPFPIVIYGNRLTLENEIDLLIKDLLNNNIDVNGVIAPIEIAKVFSLMWSKMKCCNTVDGMDMRVYELIDVKHPEYSNGNFRVANEEDLKTVSTWIYNLEKSEGSNITYEKAYEMSKNKIINRELYIWEDKTPVSMACTARPTNNGVVVNMVYTPPELRGRGYASSCVASLSQHLLNTGYKFCSLVTDLSNPISNSIYMRIGYKPICDYKEYWFKY